MLENADLPCVSTIGEDDISQENVKNMFSPNCTIYLSDISSEVSKDHDFDRLNRSTGFIYIYLKIFMLHIEPTWPAEAVTP
jgi:hypothetical protein